LSGEKNSEQITSLIEKRHQRCWTLSDRAGF
jgi:hypothetical protein